MSESEEFSREPDSDADDVVRRPVSDWSSVEFIMTGTAPEIDGDGLTQNAESLQPVKGSVLEIVQDGETVARFIDTGTEGSK
jgi:hypothetical protein